MFQALRGSKLWGYLGLFSSFSTLFCCALPALFVVLGMGSTLAGLIGEFPQLVWFSENKGIVFTVSLLMLGLSYFSTRMSVCPVDRKENCEEVKSWTRPLFLVSLVINLVGVTYAFVLPNL